MNTELRIVRLKYSVIEMLSIVQFQFYSVRKNRQQKNKAAHPKGQTASWYQLSLTEPTGPVVK